MKASAKVHGLQPPVAEPKTNAPSLSWARVRGTRTEVVDEDDDVRMRAAIIERVLRSVQARGPAESPVRGDIRCTGGHVGIYLGNYAGKDLYISAHDDAMDVLGIVEQLTHGSQIKHTEAGIYRRCQP